MLWTLQIWREESLVIVYLGLELVDKLDIEIPQLKSELPSRLWIVERFMTGGNEEIDTYYLLSDSRVQCTNRDDGLSIHQSSSGTYVLLLL